MGYTGPGVDTKPRRVDRQQVPEPNWGSSVVSCVNMNVFKRYQLWLHLIGWLVFIGLPFLTLPNFLWNRQDLVSIGMAQLLSSTLIIGYFYLTLYKLTPKLLERHGTGKGGLSVQQFLLIMVGMLVSVAAVRYASFYLFPPGSLTPPARPPADMPAPPPRGKPGPHSPWPGALSSGIAFGFAMMVSSLIALFRFHTRSQEAQQQMTLEKVSAELAMLKLQVSPHFLFNTLNNIRWLARRKSDQTEAAVVTLAQLLRYMIYQAQQDRVPLRQEVEHLKHYIDLQQMRLADKHTVSFTCEGDIDAHLIEPLLFIPFVENAFKYGLHGQQESHIRISLNVTDDTLTFRTDNPMAQLVADQAVPANAASSGAGVVESGIGVANVQKRLALHYPGRHALTLTGEHNRFRVVLTIHLAHE